MSRGAEQINGPNPREFFRAGCVFDEEDCLHVELTSSGRFHFVWEDSATKEQSVMVERDKAIELAIKLLEKAQAPEQYLLLLRAWGLR